MTDLVLSSHVLHRDLHVRMIAPSAMQPGAPVVYLLHGAGATFRDWSNESSIADLAARGVLLVMPDAGESYYINDARGVRYEDFFITELLAEVHRQFPLAASDRAHTAVVGISRGGFGAAVFALKHPDLFSYVGGMSSAFDLANRRFRWRAPIESLEYRKVFGPPGSAIRSSNDPNVLVQHIEPAAAPYFYLSCGKKDVLLPANERLVARLRERGLAHEFHLVEGDHDWGVWGAQVPALETSLLAHFGLAPKASAAQ